MSLSRVGRHSFRNSMTVTLLPKLLKIPANSIPITPAPIIHRRCGICLMSSNSVDVITLGRSIPSIGGILACDPVAIMMLSAVISSSPTTTVLPPFNCAFPCRKVIPGKDISISTPLRNCSTICCLRSMTFWKLISGNVEGNGRP